MLLNKSIKKALRNKLEGKNDKEGDGKKEE